MKLKIFCLILVTTIIFVSLISCKTLSVIPFSTPPAMYKINRIETTKDFVFEYQKSIIKISEWQAWFNIQVGSNYYNFNGVSNASKK